MPAATTVSKGTEISVKLNSGSKNRKPTKHQNHRFGRIRREGDEEIVREAQSDYGQSESDKTDEEDSHSESSAVSLPDSHLPSSSQSQPTPGHSNGHDSTLSDASEPAPSTGKPLLDALMEPRLDWSDAVFASEGDVPVIQFGEMGSRDDAETTDVFSEDQAAAADSAPGYRGAPPTFRRHVGMSARQVYLKRLENDPAYTPRVGEFWGHDERLLDKDLRSLSGWWRDKRTGGSRGGMASSSSGDQSRGSFASPMRGGSSWRGRGGGGVAPQTPVDPVDQAWKHDGFEEMKKVEEFQEARSRAISDAASRGGFGARGRGRGGIMRGSPLLGRVARSNSVATPSPPSPQGPLRPYGHVRAHSTAWNRYEHAWTKHAVTFLFQDALNRPKNGDEIGIRVKLPGQLRFNVVRVSKSSPVASPATENGSTQTIPRTIVVKLPKRAKQETNQATDPENVRTVSSPPLPEEAVSEVPTIALPIVTTTVPAEKAYPTPANEAPMTDDTTPSVEQNVPSEPPRMDQLTQPPPREIPTLQLLTNFSESTPSPAYSSPSFGPGYYHPVPRPSVAYPPQGMLNGDQPMWHDPRMPYGYPTPPPLPGHHMYTPPQAARHVHHHSYSASHPHHYMSQQSAVPPYYGQQPLPMQEFHQPPPVDYGQPAASQPDRRPQPAFTYGADGAMIDVQTGTPIFSLAKSAVKVAIRRPGDTDEPPAQQQQSESTGDNSKANEAPESTPAKDAVAAANSNHYRQQSRPEMAMPPQGFVPEHVHGHPSQQFWNGYPQAPNGYYYQQPIYGVPQPQEYGYGQSIQGQAPPMHGYPQPHYEDGLEYQPHVYY